MKEYYFKVRKKGTKDNPTTIFGVENADAYRRQMKANGYTVLECGSLKPNWRQLHEQALSIRTHNGRVTDEDRKQADAIEQTAIETVCDCTTCKADCSFAGQSAATVAIRKNCKHYI